MNRDDVIRMARDAGLLGPEDTEQDIIECGLEIWVSGERGMNELERFAALVAAAERNKKPHSLGSGQMELSLRREHKGELFECQYRFTAEQVMHGRDWMVSEVAKQLDTEIDRSIRARGQA